MRAKPNLQGFSLIELMVAIVLMGIVLAIAMPSYSDWIQNTRIRTAAESIQNGIQVARAEAVKRNASVRFEMGDNASWEVKCETVVGDTDGDGIDDCPAIIQERAAGEGSSALIVVTPNPAAATTLVFNSLGRLSRLSGGVAPPNNIQLNVDSSILPPEQSRDLRIMVGIGGNTRLCDPDTGISPSDPRAC